MATESFVSQLGQEVEVPGFGFVRFDISYGGAFYAIPPASQIGLSLMETPLAHLVRAGVAVTETVRGAIPINHPDEPDLGFLYGTILTDDVDIGNICGRPSYNICIFAEGQIDRSPTGSGVTARLALAAAKGQMEVGQSCEIRASPGVASLEHSRGHIETSTALYLARRYPVPPFIPVDASSCPQSSQTMSPK